MKIGRHFASFSEAIRVGAKLRPRQCFNALSKDSQNATCAQGAGLEAIVGDGFERIDRDDLRELLETQGWFEYLSQPPSVSPCGCVFDADTLANEFGSPIYKSCLWMAVVHLNNIHRWTRERIADWLYAEEEKLGFVTIDTEASKPEMIAEPSTSEVTVQFAALNK